MCHTKKSQIKTLKDSLKKGFMTECINHIESINFGDVFEYHLQIDFQNGVYNKLSEEEIDSIISNLEDSIKIQLSFVEIN